MKRTIQLTEDFITSIVLQELKESVILNKNARIGYDDEIHKSLLRVIEYYSTSEEYEQYLEELKQ